MKKTHSKSDWISFFPFAVPRPEQEAAINFILDQFATGIKYVCADLATGIGKSAIAVTVARYLKSTTYVLTTQKILQDQYERDFGQFSKLNVLTNIKSSSNYKCSYYCNQSCGDSKRVLKSLGDRLKGTEFYQNCSTNCVYTQAKKTFVEHDLGVTNFSYFLAETQYAGALKPRDLLIIDECFQEDTRIWVKDNKYSTIHQIFHNPKITHVMSFNQEKNEYESKKIIRRVRIPFDKSTDWYEILAVIDGKNYRLVATSNHKIWTKNRGYVRADCLTTDDIIKIDTSLKVKGNFSTTRGKTFPQIKNKKCLICGKVFSKHGFKRHQASVCEIRTCANDNCFKKFEIAQHQYDWENLGNLKKRFCSYACYSSSAITSENRSARMKINNPSFNHNNVEKMRNSLKLSWINLAAEEKLKRLEIFRKAPLHENRKKPNKLEQQIIDLKIPNTVFTGLGTKWVTFKNGKHKNPDFIVENTNKVIEVGDVYYWHTQEEIDNVVQQYNEIGYDCLYITNKDLIENYDETLIAIKKHVFNHDTKISSIRKMQPQSVKKNKKQYKYNLEIEDNHNYFANNVLVSNCHNIETTLSAYVEISFSEYFSSKILKIKNFPTSFIQKDVFEWIKTTYVKAVKKQLDVTAKSIFKCYNNEQTDELDALSKQLTFLDKHLCNVNRFINLYDEKNWVINIAETDKTRSKKIEFKPVDVSPFAHDSLFNYGQKVLMLSATIINKNAFCRSVGLKPSEVAYLHMLCPFPKENRLVHVMPVGKMSFSNIDQTLPLMAEAITALLENHNDVKGLIHCVSYKIAKYLLENVKSDRLLTHDSFNREEILRIHKESSKPTVLLSPSMAEGVDLSDDFSRFQVLCKVPFPPLQDELVKKRMQRDSEWYPYQTIKTIIQSLGRSIRNENDHAVSYILDEDWIFFQKRNKKLLSEDFLSILRND